MVKAAHFRNTARVIRDRAICVNRNCNTCCRKHADSRQSNTIQTAYLERNENTYANQYNRNRRRFHTNRQTADNRCCRACFGLVRNFLNRPVIAGGINLCNNTNEQTNNQTRNDSDSRFHVAKEFPAQREGSNNDQHCGGIGTRFQGLMRVGIFIAPYEERTDNRCQNANSRQYQREHCAFHSKRSQAQRDSGDNGADIGLEQVCAHARNVAYVIAYVICNNRRVTGVILRNARLYLTNKIRANVCRLCVYTAANTSEQSNRGRAKAKTKQNVRIARYSINRAHAQKAKADNGHAHNRTAAESDRQGFVHTAGSCCVRSSYIGLCCYGHAKIASQRGEYRANNKADRRFPADAEANQQKQNNSENNQNFIFRFQERVCAFSDGTRNFFHAVGSLVHLPYPAGKDEGKYQRHNAQHRRQIHHFFHN